MGKIIKMLLGIILIVVGAYLTYFWWFFVLTLIKGGVGIFLILVGLITIAVAGE